MNENLRRYIDALFAGAERTAGTAELKEEILQNLTDKYNDLIAEGKSPETAYNIAISSVGDISELLNTGVVPQNAKSTEPAKRRSPVLTAIAVFMYIVCVVPLFLLQNVMGLVLMFVLIAAATALLIIGGGGKHEEDDDEYPGEPVERRRVRKSVNGAVWTLATLVYLLISFNTGAWYITWMVFPITAAITSVIDAIFDLSQKQ